MMVRTQDYTRTRNSISKKSESPKKEEIKSFAEFLKVDFGSVSSPYWKDNKYKCLTSRCSFRPKTNKSSRVHDEWLHNRIVTPLDFHLKKKIKVQKEFDKNVLQDLMSHSDPFTFEFPIEDVKMTNKKIRSVLNPASKEEEIKKFLTRSKLMSKFKNAKILGHKSKFKQKLNYWLTHREEQSRKNIKNKKLWLDKDQGYHREFKLKTLIKDSINLLPNDKLTVKLNKKRLKIKSPSLLIRYHKSKVRATSSMLTHRQKIGYNKMFEL